MKNGKGISSPNAFKTSYIADVKEELGLIERKAPNRVGKRKHKAPERLKPFIREAILFLQDREEKMTYKKIQQKALEFYKREEMKKKSRVDHYFGVVKPNVSQDFIQRVVEDEDFGYED